MKVSRGAVLWMDATPRPIDEIMVSQGPLDSVRVELLVPISHLQTDDGRCSSEAIIFNLELEARVARELAGQLLAKTQGKGEGV